jgi:4-hydroxythreonine-4-phosphate dehydrogenase
MTDNKLVNIAITSGEPAGIGPEVSYRAAKEFLQSYPDVKITLMGDAQLFDQFAAQNTDRDVLSRLDILSYPLAQKNIPGQLNVENAPYVIQMLDDAFKGCQQGRYQAMVTAPVQKSIINDAGIPFRGHTEYLAEKANVKRVVMMLCGKPNFDFDELPRDLRVALVTTHLPLQQVAKAIDFEAVIETIRILNHDLVAHFGIQHPKIRVAGLNPHAGESGHLGMEEIHTILPAIEQAKKEGIDAQGPFPGDTIFDLKQLVTTDAILAMYHDQGLAPFKFATFGVGVNVTLGLPMIRTSVDHGTALDLAGKNQADAGSMMAALELAYELAKAKELVKVKQAK